MISIRQKLVSINPWWESDFKQEFKSRDIYARIERAMKMPQIIALTGLRRVGKTTLMLKIVQDNISKDYNKKNIVYFSFDEFKEADIRDVIREYELLFKTNLKDGKYLLLLDEIQKVNGWQEQLKAVYDLYKGDVKIIISGSETLFIRKKTRDSLAGRIFEFKVGLLSFPEYLRFVGIELEQIELYEKELTAQLEDFIQCQGFPELIGVKDRQNISDYIRSIVIDKTLYSDILNLFKIDEIHTLESLLKIIMEEPGQIIELSKLSMEMGVSRQTLSKYLFYLESAFLIRKLYNFSKSKRKGERKLKKFYPTILSPDIIYSNDENIKPKVFEWLVVSQLNAEFFWRDEYKNEVDIVLVGNGIKPVEVKYGKVDTKGIIRFMDKFKIAEGYVITYNKKAELSVENKKIHEIPVYALLLENMLDESKQQA